jgi:hypothetical protein
VDVFGACQKKKQFLKQEKKQKEKKKEKQNKKWNVNSQRLQE